MNRAFQAFALVLSIGMLTFLACRAQSSKQAPPANDMANPAAPDDPAAATPDAAPAPPEPPEQPVYFPASKSGGAFIEHQQAPH